jgi:hypothetical protein
MYLQGTNEDLKDRLAKMRTAKGKAEQQVYRLQVEKEMLKMELNSPEAFRIM